MSQIDKAEIKTPKFDWIELKHESGVDKGPINDGLIKKALPIPFKPHSLKEKIIRIWTQLKHSACIQKLISVWKELFQKEPLRPLIPQHIPVIKPVYRENFANLSPVEVPIQKDNHPKPLNIEKYNINLPKENPGYQKPTPEKTPKPIDKLTIDPQKEEPFKLATEPLIEYALDEIMAPDEQEGMHAGIRTLDMFAFLKRFPAYHLADNLITLQGKRYTPLTAGVKNISTKAVASCGSSNNREILVMDPNHSPALAKHFNKLLIIIQNAQAANGGDISEEAILNLVRDYVRHRIFTSRNDPQLIAKVNGFVQYYQNDPNWPKAEFKSSQGKFQVPIIPIDEFILSGLGVCRHHALVTSYLLDRLTKEPKGAPILQGTVQHMRDNIPLNKDQFGGHVWVTFISSKPSKKRWHIDTLWREIIDFSKPQGIAYLKLRGYGELAIENQIKKANRLGQKDAVQKDKVAIVNEEIKKECVGYISTVAKGILEAAHCSSYRYIISPSNDKYSVSYLDDLRQYRKIRIQITNKGKIETENKEIFESFEAFKKRFNLTEHYSREETFAKMNLNDQLFKRFNYLDADNYLLKENKEGDFLIRPCSNMDAYALHYILRYNDQILTYETRFTFNKDGSVYFYKEDFRSLKSLEEFKNKLNLKKQILPNDLKF